MYRKREYSLVGDKVVLVPYRQYHVEKYHSWMQDPVLRTQTASEPLCLEQEYQMQQSWMTDEDKCTFIILSKELYNREHTSEVECMAGDVNLFFNDPDDSVAEIEIMIAEPSCRGKGLGLEATQLMMYYAQVPGIYGSKQTEYEGIAQGQGITELKVKKFCAKIDYNNQPSLQLFQKKLHFIETKRLRSHYPLLQISRSEVFLQFTLELAVTDELLTHYVTKFDNIENKWRKHDLL